MFFSEKTTARSSTGKTKVFSGKVFRPKVGPCHKCPKEGLGQVPKGPLAQSAVIKNSD
jgi:hypothetical protein